MRIRTQFVTSMALFGLTLSAIAVSVVVTGDQVAGLDQQEGAAAAVGLGASELAYLAGNYVLFGEEQQRIRWEAKWVSVSEEVARVEPQGAEERALVRSLRTDLTQLREVFEDVVRTTRSSPDALTPVSWSRLAVQNQTLAFNASRLSQVLRNRKADIQRRQGVLIVALLGIFGAYFAVMYRIVYQRALRSLAEVQAGTEIIGRGDLDHTIPVKRNDEIGSLTRAFNKMTGDLKGVTASRARLEEEIAEREAAEEALRDSIAQMEELSEARQQELATTKLLLDASDALSSSTDLRELAGRLAEVLVKVSSHSRSIVGAYDKRRDEVEVLSSAGEMALPTGSRWPLERASVALRTAIAERRTLIFDLDQLTEDERGQGAVSYGMRKALYVPLVQREEVVGVVVLDDPGRRGEFPDDEIDLIEGIASQAAVAIENARLYEAEHRISDELQSALLAMPDEVLGIEFTHAYRSATDTARVGGDFYDIFELSHHHAGITIGDVAGKGLDAAVLTALAKNTIRAHAAERGKTPARILSLANEVVYKATPAESFVTVFFGILDCRDGRLVYANAGHTTALIVKSDGTCSKLAATGPILGAFEQVDFGQEEGCLDFGEVLFLYTDGLTEARRDGEFYGEGRLLEFLPKTRDEAPVRVVEDVIGEVLDFSGGRFSDDLAILAVKRAEHPSEAPKQQKLEL